MRTQPIGIIFLVLSSAVLAPGQITTPTGIQRTGFVSLMRAESKIAIGSAPPFGGTTDTASGGFDSIDYTNYTPPTGPPLTMIGPCTVYSFTLPAPPQPPTSIPITFLDGGPVINLNGPNGPTQLPKTMGVYSAALGGGVAFPTPGAPAPKPLYLDPGTYTVDNGGGGADVGSFGATLNVPSPGFVWTNADADLTITLAAGVDIQWSGGDPTTNVRIIGLAGTPTVVGGFTCTVPNNGEFMVTPDVLSYLPATPTGPATFSTLNVTNSSATNFSATGIDLGIVSYQAGGTRTVVYQ